jgi:hypothetical protein
VIINITPATLQNLPFLSSVKENHQRISLRHERRF